MTDPRFDLDELLGDASPDERDRLRRVHELLVEAGPPPELSPELEVTPEPPSAQIHLFPRRYRYSTVDRGRGRRGDVVRGRLLRRRRHRPEPRRADRRDERPGWCAKQRSTSSRQTRRATGRWSSASPGFRRSRRDSTTRSGSRWTASSPTSAERSRSRVGRRSSHSMRRTRSRSTRAGSSSRKDRATSCFGRLPCRPCTSARSPAATSTQCTASPAAARPPTRSRSSRRLEQVAEMFDETHFDPATDGRVVEVDGTPVAWLRTWHEPSGVRLERAYLFGDVEPQFRSPWDRHRPGRPGALREPASSSARTATGSLCTSVATRSRGRPTSPASTPPRASRRCDGTTSCCEPLDRSDSRAGGRRDRDRPLGALPPRGVPTGQQRRLRGSLGLDPHRRR